MESSDNNKKNEQASEEIVADYGPYGQISKLDLMSDVGYVEASSFMSFRT